MVTVRQGSRPSDRARCLLLLSTPLSPKSFSLTLCDPFEPEPLRLLVIDLEVSAKEEQGVDLSKRGSKNHMPTITWHV